MARRRLHDEYFRRAKAEGYVARSAYKLKEICDRRKLLSPGQRVLDLGCAPGSWLQVASERVGKRGLVVGVDLNPVKSPMPANAHHFEADVFAPDLCARLASLLGENAPRFDAILSDMAPSTSGAGDHFASAELCDRVLELAPSLLRPGGDLAMKILEGERYMELIHAAGAVFRASRGFKPKASRDASSEMYIIARGYAPASEPDGRHAAGSERRGADRP